MRKVLPGLLALAAALVFTIWAYPQLPERIVTHWDLQGQANGWSSRSVGATFGLGVAGLMLLVFSQLPRIDPLKRNYELHGSTYWTLVNAVLGLLAAVQAIVIAQALGWAFDVGLVVGVGVGALFVLIGNLMTRMRPNWFMGIRTPWTLSSESVWRKTHRVGGRLFVVAGVALGLIGVLRTRWMLAVGLAVMAVAVVVPIVYSWMLWRREQALAESSGEQSSS